MTVVEMSTKTLGCDSVEGSGSGSSDKLGNLGQISSQGKVLRGQERKDFGMEGQRIRAGVTIEDNQINYALAPLVLHSSIRFIKPPILLLVYLA